MTGETERVPLDTRLRAAIDQLSTMGDGPRVRLALAEAEFRLAVALGTSPADAVRLLRSAIRHDPFQPKLYLHLGRLLHLAGRHRAAVAEYRHVLALAPASRRAPTMLTQALLELDQPEREIGSALLAALGAGSSEQVRAVLTDLDKLLADQAAGHRKPSDGDAAGADGSRGKDRGRVARRRARQAPPPGTGDAAAGGSDHWRISLLTELSQARPQPTRITACLDTGSAERARTGPDEYAVACLLLLAGGHLTEVRRRVSAGSVDQAASHPAVGMLLAAAELADTAEAEAFVTTAGRYVTQGLIPESLCCWLHFARYGPDAGLPVTRAIRLLDAYPPQLRDQAWFRELRIAVLDGYARRAWTAGRLAEARLLWREAAQLDPYRLPVAVNLLLLAARTRVEAEYTLAWDRLLQLLYVLPAGAGDIQLHLAERRDLHHAVSQQSRRRHCPGAGIAPSSAELDAWLADPDALHAWLCEWDRYYLNARLSFRSPLHILGVPRNVSEQALTEAREALLRLLDRAVRQQPWAGVAVFCELATVVVDEAFAQAREAVARLRDVHHEPESERAEALEQELLSRSMTLHQMLAAVVRTESPGEQLRLGCDIARRLFSLPRSAVHRAWVRAGFIEDDDDITEILEVGLFKVAAQWDPPVPADAAGWGRRLADLDECVALLPRRIALRLLRCLLFSRAQRPADAYSGALAALALPAGGEDDEPVRAELVGLVDQLGFLDVPEELRSPRDVPTLDRAVAAASSALDRYPCSGLLRLFLAQLLLADPTGNHGRRAAEVLVIGVIEALDDQQGDRCQELLDSISGSEVAAMVRQEADRTRQAASDRLHGALNALRQEPGPERVQAVGGVVAAELPKVIRALGLARRYRLTAEIKQMEETAAQLRQVSRQVGEGGG